MTKMDEMISQFRKKVCSEIELEQEGIDRYIVRNPFLFDDGDHLQIYLRKDEKGGWMLTDEGATYMELSYEDMNLDTDTRMAVMEKAKNRFGIEDVEGEFILKIKGDEYGDALFSFIQGILHVSDVEYLKKERLRSAFREEFKDLVCSTAPPEKVHIDYYDLAIDPEKIFPIDAMVDTGVRPIYIFAIANNDQCQQATISLMHFEKLGKRFQSVAVFENQVEIARKKLAQLSTVVGKQLPDLSASKDRLPRYIEEQRTLVAPC